MRIIVIYFLLSQVLHIEALSQKPRKYTTDTVNNIIFADYRAAGIKNIIDSVDTIYPNRAYVDFEGFSKYQRDSLVVQTWIKFKNELIKSINFKKHEFKHRKSALYLTLYFSKEGELRYCLFNWLKDIEFPSMTNHIIEFTSKYDFSPLLKGTTWSQCGTIVLNRLKIKKADNSR